MPEEAKKPSKRSGALDGLVQAEGLMQIAFILPISVLVGWALGYGLDKWLHQHWIYLAGVLLGCIAGFIEVFHLVQQNEKRMEKNDQ